MYYLDKITSRKQCYLDKKKREKRKKEIVNLLSFSLSLVISSLLAFKLLNLRSDDFPHLIKHLSKIKDSSETLRKSNKAFLDQTSSLFSLVYSAGKTMLIASRIRNSLIGLIIASSIKSSETVSKFESNYPVDFILLEIVLVFTMI
jgi:hypothetical protein